MRAQWVIAFHVALAMVGTAGIWLVNAGFTAGVGQVGAAFWWTPMAHLYHVGLGAALAGLWTQAFLAIWAWLRRLS